MSGSKGKRRHFVPLPSQDNIATVEHSGSTDSSSTSRNHDRHESNADILSSKPGRTSLAINSTNERSHLHRGLSTRQVQMIAVAGEGTTSQSLLVRANLSWTDRYYRNWLVFGHI